MEGYSLEPSNPFLSSPTSTSTMNIDNPQVGTTPNNADRKKNNFSSPPFSDHSSDPSDPSDGVNDVDTIMEEGARNSLGLDEIPLMETHNSAQQFGQQRQSPTLLDDTFHVHPIPGKCFQ